MGISKSLYIGYYIVAKEMPEKSSLVEWFRDLCNGSNSMVDEVDEFEDVFTTAGPYDNHAAIISNRRIGGRNADDLYYFDAGDEAVRHKFYEELSSNRGWTCLLRRLQYDKIKYQLCYGIVVVEN